MTSISMLARGLAPDRVPVHYQHTKSSDLRDYVERLRYSCFRDGRLASVISINAVAARLFRDGGSHYRKLIETMDANWAHENAVDWLDINHLGIVLPDTGANDATEFAADICKASEIPFDAITVYSRDVIEADGNRLPIDYLYQRSMPLWKRITDIIGSSILLVVAMPALLVAALLIKITSRGPVFFTQWRVGKGGRPFCIVKLRTMKADAEESKDSLRKQNEQDGLGFKIRKDPRVTTIGSWLRRTSIDELPQLFNVVKGDMSLVGPRPLPCRDWKPDSMWLCRRHDVVPGLTCTWQISGRSEIGFDEWMQMDLQYVEQRNFTTDLGLLLRTPFAVLSQKGAS